MAWPRGYPHADEDWGKMNRNKTGECVFYAFRNLHNLMKTSLIAETQIPNAGPALSLAALHRDSDSFVCFT